MPAMRPVRSISSVAASPMRAPPIAAETGVKSAKVFALGAMFLALLASVVGCRRS